VSFITYDNFNAQVKAICFPDREAEELVTTHDSYIVEGLINLQNYVPCLRDNNVNFYSKEDFQEWCNTDFTYINRGVVQAVYAFKPDRQCRKLFYDAKSVSFIDCWIAQSQCVTCAPQAEDDTPDISRSSSCDTLTTGGEACSDDYTQTSDESDCGFRNGNRYYAIGPSNKLYLAPRFPCGYTVAVHWEGIKRKYLGTEPLPDDQDLINCVAKYVQAQRALFLDHDYPLYDRIMDAKNGSFSMLRSEILRRCDKERRVQAKRECMDGFDVLAPFFYDPLNEYYED
jgi:hypothetical protein